MQEDAICQSEMQLVDFEELLQRNDTPDNPLRLTEDSPKLRKDPTVTTEKSCTALGKRVGRVENRVDHDDSSFVLSEKSLPTPETSFTFKAGTSIRLRVTKNLAKSLFQLLPAGYDFVGRLLNPGS